MIKILDSRLKNLAYLNAKNCLITTTNESEFTLAFVTSVKVLKTEYLKDKNNFLEIDGQRFVINALEISKQNTGATTFNVKAEHISYGLIETTFEEYSLTGTVREHLNYVLAGTGFSFLSTDIQESKTIEVKLTNARYMVNRIAKEFCGTVVWDKNNVSIFKVHGEELPLILSINKNVKGISVNVDYTEKDLDGNPYVNYKVDVRASGVKGFESCNVNDIAMVEDAELGIKSKRKIIKIEYDPILKVNKSIELGDMKQDTFVEDLLETIELNIEMPIPENVITEVIHMQVINAETAHILNAWIKNLFVEYLETNMDAKLDRTSIDRHFIRIINEREEMVYQELDTSQTEPLLIPDPRGDGGTVQVYFTSIGSHPDAYRYFTITNPKSIHTGLSDAEVAAFRVMVKKVKKEGVKYSKAFKKVKMSNGVETVTPAVIWGEGIGEGDKGKAEEYKDIVGWTLKQHNENNSGFCGIRGNAQKGAMEYYNWINQQWVPIGGTVVGGAGNVIFHKDKVALTNADLSNSNALHVGYSSTGAKIVGENSTIFLSATVLGAEIVTKAQPIDPIGKRSFYTHYDDVDGITFDTANLGKLTANNSKLQLSYPFTVRQVYNSYLQKDLNSRDATKITISIYTYIPYKVGYAPALKLDIPCFDKDRKSLASFGLEYGSCQHYGYQDLFIHTGGQFGGQRWEMPSTSGKTTEGILCIVLEKNKVTVTTPSGNTFTATNGVYPMGEFMNVSLGFIDWLKGDSECMNLDSLSVLIE